MPKVELQFNFSEDTRYGFAVGRIRALEAKLIGNSDYERLLAAGDTRTVARMLVGMGCYDRWIEPEQPDRWQAGLQAARDENLELFLSLCLEDWLARFVQLAGLMLTVKRRLKSQDRAVSPSTLNDVLKETLGISFPLKLFANQLSSTVDLRSLDILLDDLEFELSERLAPEGSFAAALVRLRKAASQLLRQARVAVYEPFDEEGLASSQVFDSEEAIRLRQLERATRRVEISFLKKAQFTAFGFEPVLAFYYLFEHELRNVACLLLPIESASVGRRDLVAYA